MTEVETARARVDDLYARRDRGDIHVRNFDEALTKGAVELYRSLAQCRLKSGESILAEHHVVLAHTKLNQSVLREADQEAISFFATEARLLRVRSLLTPDRRITGDERDQTAIDEMPFSGMRALLVRRELRKSEVLTGLIICLLALLFHSWLQVTGTLMVGLGVLGILHGLFLPTKWLEIESRDLGSDICFRIYGLGKKNARKMVSLLREKMVEV